MSQTAYFMSDEQADMLAKLLAEKIASDYPRYRTFLPVYETLTRRWTFKTPDHEQRMQEATK